MYPFMATTAPWEAGGGERTNVETHTSVSTDTRGYCPPRPGPQGAEPSTTGQPDQIIFRKLHGFTTATCTEARQQTQETQVQAVSCAHHRPSTFPSRHPPSGFSGKPAPHKRSN